MLLLCFSYASLILILCSSYVHLLLFHPVYTLYHFSFYFLFYIYIHSLLILLILLMQPTHTLSLPQIQFINQFLYSKPHSYTNPHTLFNYIRLKPLFKSLTLDFYGPHIIYTSYWLVYIIT